METKLMLRWESIGRALARLEAPEFQTPRLVRLRLQLETANAEIDELATDQRRGVDFEYRRESTKKLRDALRELHLLPISDDAPLLLEGMPGIADEFRVPSKRASGHDLLKASDRILANAERYKEAFIEGKWNEDFIDKAKEAAIAFKAKISEENTDLQRQSRATASLPAAIAKGREIMRSIDRAVVAEFGWNSVTTRSWKGAFRVPKKMGRPKRKRGDDDRPAAP